MAPEYIRHTNVAGLKQYLKQSNPEYWTEKRLKEVCEKAIERIDPRAGKPSQERAKANVLRGIIYNS